MRYQIQNLIDFFTSRLARSRLPVRLHFYCRSTVDRNVDLAELEARVLDTQCRLILHLLEPVNNFDHFDTEIVFSELPPLDWISWPAEENVAPLAIPNDLAGTNVQVTEVVFLSENVTGYEELMASISGDANRHVDVVVLDGQENGIEAITQALANYSNLGAIHIVSHGTEGKINLGNTWLSSDSLEGYAGDISSWNGTCWAQNPTC